MPDFDDFKIRLKIAKDKNKNDSEIKDNAKMPHLWGTLLN